ncbi:hypothetical protein SESBI_37012 [Sesbania bispinosa]|nr:hypothetical protein SESBI_37012 [Sesbania bispinosa]
MKGCSHGRAAAATMESHGRQGRRRCAQRAKGIKLWWCGATRTAGREKASVRQHDSGWATRTATSRWRRMEVTRQ